MFEEFSKTEKNAWVEKIKKDIKSGNIDEQLTWQSFDGFSINPVLTSADIENISSVNSLPAHYPYVRGNKINGNDWEIRQSVSVDVVTEANKKALNFLNSGINALAFNLNNNKITGKDFQLLMKDILPQYISVYFSGCENHIELTNEYINLIKHREVNSQQVKGAIEFSPLTGYYVNENKIDNWVKPTLELINNTAPFTYFRCIDIDTSIFHNSGATIVQEIAIALAQGNEYIHHLLEKGLLIDEITAKIQFSFSAGVNYFAEIAKYRAVRMLWAKVVEEYEPKHRCSMATFICAKNSEYYMAEEDYYNNVLRFTTEAMSAAIGGCDCINLQQFDLSGKENISFSERISRNIQLILKEEAHLHKVSDPSGGSYYIETLTNNIAEQSLSLFKEIESRGGYIKSVESGFIKNEISKTANAKQEAINNGKIVLTGVNKYVDAQ